MAPTPPTRRASAGTSVMWDVDPDALASEVDDAQDAPRYAKTSSASVDISSLLCPVSPSSRAALLVGVRESDAHDWLQMEGMVGQTYAGLVGNPIADAIARVGMTPMRGRPFDLKVDLGQEDGPITITVTPEVRRLHKTKAILFRVGNTYHLWCMASAATVTQMDKVNAWNQILMDLIREIRPVQVHVATISRLIRSQQQALRLQDAMTDNVDVLTFGGMQLKFTGPEAAFGHMMLTVLGMMAAQERDWIMQRLISGRIALHNRGQWQYGRSFVPYGYRYDAASKQLMIDPGTVDVVPRMVEILLSDASDASKQHQLSDIGVPMRRSKSRDGKQLPLSYAANPGQSMDHLFTSASIWAHGQYVARIRNPGLGYQHISGVPIVRGESATDGGELQMVIDLPVPDGGWLPAALKERLWTEAVGRTAASLRDGIGPRPLSPALSERYPHLDLALLASRLVPVPREVSDDARGPRRGGRAKHVISALTGRRWILAGQSMELTTSGHDRYQVRRIRPASGMGRTDV